MNNIDATNFAMSVAGRTTVFDLAGVGSELRLDFAVGTRLHAGGELYRPIGVPWLFVAPRLYANSDERNLFVDKSHVAEYRFARSGGGADLGISFGRVAELRAGADIAYVDDDPEGREPAPAGGARRRAIRCRRGSPSTTRTARSSRRAGCTRPPPRGASSRRRW